MARKLFFITVTGVVVYIAAVFFVLGSAEGADPSAAEVDPAVEVPVFVAASH